MDSGRTSKWDGEAPTPGLLGVFIHQSGGNLGGGGGPPDFVDKFDVELKDWGSVLFQVCCQPHISDHLHLDLSSS